MFTDNVSNVKANAMIEIEQPILVINRNTNSSLDSNYKLDRKTLNYRNIVDVHKNGKISEMITPADSVRLISGNCFTTCS
ncbi:hypothetical protein QR98_0090640 [Sarcoptes scabiei]|uniref:Uncharacterized protein n=1 Tax=Sarcoptes scabiei TaxID=52283 RepID=A0A132AHN0_SARSC|nr:hypothetical protein QR98_0090640 [Sarcoptes scabiei]